MGLTFYTTSLAKELLADDGVMFISIDENEYANLDLLLNEIFGEPNNLCTFIWKKKRGGGNDSVYVAVEHEYVLMVSKNREKLPPLFTPYSEEYLSRYKEVDENGRYFWDTFKRKSGKQYYPITCPDGTVLEYDENGTRISWLRSEKTFRKNLSEGEVRFQQRADGSWSVQFKQRLPKGKKLRSILTDYGTTSEGNEDIQAVFGMSVFDNPKPVRLMKHLIESTCSEGDYVLDFFSGSATTAQAVMESASTQIPGLNFILVQIDEAIVPTRSEEARNAISLGFETIDALARERINRVADRILSTAQSQVDCGYKLYFLHTPSGELLDDLMAFDPERGNALFAGDYVSKFSIGQTPGHATILHTWLNMDGYGLSAVPSKLLLGTYELDICGDTGYIIQPGLTSDDVVELVRLLENNEIDVSRMVVLGYSVTFNVMHELKKNLSVLKSGRSVSVIERL
ncbi:MAG: DNA methyltransferase [Bifidobacteriaceae bacterium]|nr:DNA methyltransferase [Bifidobacteriaceae bacterium]